MSNVARHALYVSLTQASEMSRGLFKCTTAEAVQRLVKKGANVDERRADGATPLMVHAELSNGHELVLKSQTVTNGQSAVLGDSLHRSPDNT